MEITAIENYIVDTNNLTIPDKGLGNYKCGFTEERKPFNLQNIWLNLLPFFGQILFIAHLLRHWWVRTHPCRILLYQNGFIKQSLDSHGNVKKENVFNFSTIKGILNDRVRQFQSIYAIRRYNCTTVKMWVLDANNTKVHVLGGAYRNKEEIEGNYNFIGYACNAISDAWNEIALNNFNRELLAKGYATFYTPKKEILVGRNFIKSGDMEIRPGFSYRFDNGYLYLYPDEGNKSFWKGKKSLSINVASMYNKEIFLAAISQFHGIQ